MAMYVVLIVDNEPIQRALIRESLSADRSLRFIEAHDAAMGLRLARAHQPSLIILDVHLPSINGVELCRTLKADPQLRAIPVIITTTYHDSAALRDSGCGAYLVKPFDMARLEATVQGLLRLNVN
jgi:two-component system, cell cycle response regulator DivK